MSNPPSTHEFDDVAQTWNTCLEGDTYLFGSEPNSYLRRPAFWWERGERVLCVADAKGCNSIKLTRQGLVVDAFDVSEVGVRKAVRLAAL